MDSFITHASIQAIAHSIDIPKLSDEAAKALSPDVDYRLREIIQDAQKFARHAKRAVLTVEDVNNALRLRNFEPIYGFGNKDPAKFVRATGHPDVCIVHDRELTFDQLLDEPLPRPPVEIGLTPHWLFINGVQPAIPENAPIARPVAKRARVQRGKAAGGRGGAATEKAPGAPAADGAPAAVAASGSAAALTSNLVRVQQPVRHLLSRELQLYFDKVVLLLKAPATEGAAAGAAAAPGAGAQSPAEAARLQRAALASLATDPGLHPLAPYFAKFVADEVAAGLRSLPTLHMVLRLVSALLQNPDMKLEHYVHQLLPPVLTCLVAKNLGTHTLEDHWSLREAAAGVVRLVCSRFSDPFFNVQPRISKTLLKALLDPTKPLATHYGAVIGLAALGHATVSLLLVPQLAPYMSRLIPLMQDGADPLRRAEAYRMHGALADAVAAAMFERLLAAAATVLPTALPRLRKGPKSVDSRGAAGASGTTKPTDTPNAQNGSSSAVKDSGTSDASAPTTDDQGDVKMEDAGGARDVQQPRAPAPAGAGSGSTWQAQGGQLPGRDSTGLRQPELDEDNVQLLHLILTESWREDADLSQVLWALQQLFEEELLARMPSPYLAAMRL